MPPLPIIGNVYRCALNWTNGTGQDAVNVIHLLTATSESQEDVFNGLEDSVTHEMWVSVHDSFSVTTVDVTPLDGTSATNTFAANPDGRWTGSGGLDPIPAVSALVKLNTSNRGRSHRGRIFLPFTSEESNVGGFLSASAAAFMQPAWEAFLAALVGFSKTLMVASYTLGTADSVTAVTVETALATQRRRQERLRA